MLVFNLMNRLACLLLISGDIFSVVIFEIDGSHTLLHMPFTCPEFARMIVGLVVARMLYEHFLFGCHAV